MLQAHNNVERTNFPGPFGLSEGSIPKTFQDAIAILARETATQSGNFWVRADPGNLYQRFIIGFGPVVPSNKVPNGIIIELPVDTPLQFGRSYPCVSAEQQQILDKALEIRVEKIQSAWEQDQMTCVRPLEQSFVNLKRLLEEAWSDAGPQLQAEVKDEILNIKAAWTMAFGENPEVNAQCEEAVAEINNKGISWGVQETVENLLGLQNFTLGREGGLETVQFVTNYLSARKIQARYQAYEAATQQYGGA